MSKDFVFYGSQLEHLVLGRLAPRVQISLQVVQTVGQEVDPHFILAATSGDQCSL